jgi:hypothetical protein
MKTKASRPIWLKNIFAIFVLLVCMYSVFSYVENEKRIVREQAAEIKSAQERLQKQQAIDIAKTPIGKQATRDELLKLLIPGNPSSVYTIVDTVHANETLVRSCHEIAHDIGHAAFDMYGFTDAMNFTDISRVGKTTVQEICAGGYVHGVIEKAALGDSEFSQNPGKVCSTADVNLQSTCYHGVGHALMYDAKRDTSLAMMGCRKLPSTNAITRCFEGVWMEFFWAIPRDSEYAYDSNNPLPICSSIQKDEKPACYLYSIFGYLKHHPEQYSKAIALCTTSNISSSDEYFCLKGIGIGMVRYYDAVALERAEVFTTNLNKYQRKGFYEGLFGYARFAGVSKDSLNTMCQRLRRDTTMCLQIIASYQP